MHTGLCPSRADLERIAVETRGKMLRRVLEEAKGGSTVPIACLPLLGPATEGLRRGYQDHIKSLEKMHVDKDVTLRIARKHDIRHNVYGLIPEGLSDCLREMGVGKKESKALAEELTVMAHEAIRDAYYSRIRIIAEERGYKANYKHHMYGIGQAHPNPVPAFLPLPQPQPPPPPAPQGGPVGIG